MVLLLLTFFYIHQALSFKVLFRAAAGGFILVCIWLHQYTQSYNKVLTEFDVMAFATNLQTKESKCTEQR